MKKIIGYGFYALPFIIILRIAVECIGYDAVFVSVGATVLVIGVVVGCVYIGSRFLEK